MTNKSRVTDNYSYFFTQARFRWICTNTQPLLRILIPILPLSSNITLLSTQLDLLIRSGCYILLALGKISV